MTTQSKALGNGLETRVVKRAERLGLTARRQPGSGVYAGWPNDVLVYNNADITALVECKVRSTHPSMAQMLAWLDEVERNSGQCADFGCLVYNVKGSRKPKVLLDLDTFLSLLAH